MSNSPGRCVDKSFRPAYRALEGVLMVGVLKTALRKIWRTFSPNFPASSMELYVGGVRYPGLRLTPWRLANFFLARFQRLLGHTRLLGYPLILIVEAANACNLRCPYCFIGAGATSRDRRFFSIPLYRQLLRELGDYLLAVVSSPVVARHRRPAVAGPA